jgi:hypothetical protein
VVTVGGKSIKGKNRDDVDDGDNYEVENQFE